MTPQEKLIDSLGQIIFRAEIHLGGLRSYGAKGFPNSNIVSLADDVQADLEQLKELKTKMLDALDERDNISSVVACVRAEHARCMEFGMTPGIEDYRIAIEDWLVNGKMPKNEVAGHKNP